jgi:arylsulfatase A
MTSRREFLGALGATATASAAPARPNVILITADDLGYNELSCYGQTQFATPHIDALARDGARFTDHYAGAPVCAPSRCCLLTGLHSGHGRVRNNFTPDHGRAGLRRQDFTVAEMFQRAGYRTAIFGKWGLGEEGTEGIPNRKGFDSFFGFLNQNEAHNHYPDYLWRNQEKVKLNGEYAQDLFTAEGLKFIRENTGRPFFLFMAYTLPHADLTAPEAYVARFRGKFPGEGPVKGKGKGKVKAAADASPNEIFAAMMAKLDDDVGRLLALLGEQGLAGNTLVLFNGDNGPHNKGRDPEYFHSAGSFRGIKGDVYEGGIRVPLIARWPGRIRAGSVVRHPVAFWDYLPTLADLVGAESPRGIDGISFLPAMTGSGEQRSHESLYWEFNQKGTGWQAARSGNWKAVRPGKGGPVELYDLASDPGEHKNHASTNAAVAKRMERYLADRAESDEFPLYADYKGGPE